MLLFGIFTLLVKISIEDYFHRRVRHRYLIALLLILLSLWNVFPNYDVLPYTFAILVSGVVLFSLRLLGAGDTKLLVVLSLGIDPALISILLYATVILGFLLAVAYLVYGCLYDLSLVREKGIPYAIPISVSGGCCIALSYMDWFDINF